MNCRAAAPCLIPAPAVRDDGYAPAVTCQYPLGSQPAINPAEESSMKNIHAMIGLVVVLRKAYAFHDEFRQLKEKDKWSAR
jgi:hypothetical protein